MISLFLRLLGEFFHHSCAGLILVIFLGPKHFSTNVGKRNVHQYTVNSLFPNITSVQMKLVNKSPGMNGLIRLYFNDLYSSSIEDAW